MATASFAELHECGQPSSSGRRPTATDALTVLRAAIGIATYCDSRPCICDVSGNAAITANDALRTLKIAVGQPGKGIVLACDCETFPCTSATLTVSPGSNMDTGWTGIAHGDPLASGFSVEMEIVRRCTGDDRVCRTAEDCDEESSCEPTCDCISDMTCDLAAGTVQRRCAHSFNPCVSNTDCENNFDHCVDLAAPPIPLARAGIPLCVTPRFASPLVGTADFATGAVAYSSRLVMAVQLGLENDQPCPQCGAAEMKPEPGDVFTCIGGATDGAACSVAAVHPWFGGTSYDCAPDSFSFEQFLPLRLEATTGTTTRVAQLPCGDPRFNANPLAPGSNPKCIDRNLAGDPACTSNADCRRCTEDPATACTSNENCSGKGVCAEAPDQPVTCGYWCNCGFCGGNSNLPCFESSDCPAGQQCEVGPGLFTSPNAPQAKPNDCSNDGNICGMTEDEMCADTSLGECSDKPFLVCTQNSTCEDNDGGECIIASRPCFEPRITRTGEPAPPGRYCAVAPVACTTDGDCPHPGDYCADDTLIPETVALACVSATWISSINESQGITGPAAFRFRNHLRFHRY